MAVDYGLSADYCAVCAAMLTRTGWWARLGRHIDPQGLSGGATAVYWVARKLPHPVTSLSLKEALQQYANDGVLSPQAAQDGVEALVAGAEILEDTDISVDEAIAVVSPVVRSEHRRQLLERGVEQFAQGADLSDLGAQLATIEHIGETDAQADEGCVEDIADVLGNRGRVRRMTLGIPELDIRLGGVPCGTETVFVGGPGDGKSMALSQVAAHAVEHLGLNVAIITLEIPTHTWNARLGAALTGVPTEMLTQASPPVLAKVRAKLAEIGPGMGASTTRYATPQATTVSEVLEWVAQLERAWRAPVDVLVIDYADKLAPEGKKEQASTYEGARQVYERLRIWAAENNRWVITASQAKTRGKDRKRKRDVEDAADSMHKARVCDLMVTLNADEGPNGERQVSLYVAKNRLGEAHFSAGPLTTAFDCGRLTT